jgi:preprotein translocase subunit SecB
MTDAAAGGAQAGGPGGQPTIPALAVNAQYVKDLSFENPNAPQSLMQMKGAPDVSVNVDVGVRKLADKTYEVVLGARGEGSSNGTALFIAEVQYAGVFTLGDVPEEYVQPLLMIEAPRLLFPFARAIISDCVRDGGFPPLMIHPIDFVALYQQRVAQAQEAGGGATAPASAPAGNGAGKGEGGKEGGPKFEFEL